MGIKNIERILMEECNAVAAGGAWWAVKTATETGKRLQCAWRPYGVEEAGGWPKYG